MQGVGPAKLNYVQALRGVAVFLVTAYHFPGAGRLGLSGYIGVDFFFVISGFIMVLTTSDNDGSLAYFRTFLIKRFARIWPAYVISTVVILLVFYDPLENLAFFLKSISFQPLWFTLPINKPGWSLTFEMYFYLLFALSLLAGRYRWVALITLFALTMIALPLAGGKSPNLQLTISSFGGEGLGAVLSVMIDKMNWNFLLGVGVGLLYQSKATLRSPIVAGAVVIAVTLALIRLYIPVSFDHGPIWGAMFAVILASLSLHSKTSTIYAPKFLIFLGDISYSIYITHWLVVDLIARNLSAWMAAHYLPTMILYFATILAISYPFHLVVERRISDRFRDGLTGRWRQSRLIATVRGAAGIAHDRTGSDRIA